MFLKFTGIFLLLLTGCESVAGQSLTGIWSGKISRKSPNLQGVESIEMQINQSGRRLSGYSFSFKDTSRFVLYDMRGTRDKKTQTIRVKESGYGYYLLPPGFLPCEKEFSLRYYKIGNTQYLSGIWAGRGYDTSCFPGEELLVVLQKIKKPEYPIEQFVHKKMFDYFQRKIPAPDTLSFPNVHINETVTTVAVNKPDSLPAERKLEIQQIIKVSDTVTHVSLYDNAMIDDDTVSVFVDKKPVLFRQRISDKPLSFQIGVSEPGRPTEIIMQAENLGSIPPNTAFMLIQAGKKRYEIRLKSTFEKHAVVIITYEPDDQKY